jgi:hypothetical protein
LKKSTPANFHAAMLLLTACAFTLLLLVLLLLTQSGRNVAIRRSISADHIRIAKALVTPANLHAPTLLLTAYAFTLLLPQSGRSGATLSSSSSTST